ncbi:tetratricopeptide repeat protein [Desulfobacterales bacterium HSG16]|nr:tetratricopeptide repeat protein [Desulfobacterales bacterium HSG16]
METRQNNYVKKETMLIAISIALVAGFISGVFFGVYKSGKAALPASIHKQTQNKPAPGNDRNLTAMIDGIVKQVAKNPEDYKALIQLGNLYFDSGQFKNAIDAYEKSLAISPDNADVLTDLGVMYRRTKQYQKAVQSFDKAIAANPKHEVSRFNKGIVLLHDVNDKDGAIQAWKGLLAINPVAMTSTGQPIEELVEHYTAGHED